MKKTFAYSTLLLASIAISIGCTPRALEPGAQNLNVAADHNLQVPKNCKFLGQISDANVHGGNVYFASEKAMELDDINFLKNEGARLGANVVVFTQHQIMTSTGKFYGPKNQIRTYKVVKHNVQGNAYLCPQNAMPSLNQMKTKHVTEDKNTLIIQQYSVEKSGMLLSK
jgi:hypothetical protein